MIYIIIGLTGLLILVALFTFFFRHRSHVEEDTVIPDAECCGAHAVCEKGLKKADPHIEYFEDEELDTLKHIASDAYSDNQLDMFRDILYTLKREEIEDWFISLEKREINFPDSLKQEALELMKTD